MGKNKTQQKKAPPGRQATAAHPFLAVVLITAAALLMWSLRGMPVDDGMIYLRYAYNLANGYGLVYNPGEYYESNTNFLWSVLLVPSFWFGWEPVMFMQLSGVVLMAAVLCLLYDIVRQVSGGAAALTAVLLLVTHATFVFVAPTGFAPHLLSLFLLSAITFYLRWAKQPRTRYAVAVGVSLALLLITRLDAVLLFAVLWMMLCLSAVPTRAGALHRRLILGFPLCIFAFYLFCKWRYYGDVLPATYYIKASGRLPDEFNSVRRGLIYVWLYMKSYGWFVLLPLCAWLTYRPMVRFWRGQKFKNKFAVLRHRQAWVVVTCVLLTAVQSLYMLRIGGGYLEFRFMAVVAPFVCILIALATAQMRRPLAAAVVAVAVSLSLLHWQTFESQSRDEASAPIGPILWYPTKADPLLLRWRGIGEGLANFFGELGDYPPAVKTAITAGGYVPYYSRLYALEIYGWANPRVTEEGNHLLSSDHPFPGHHFRASYRFMSEQGINLVFGYPLVVPDGADVQPFLNRFARGNLPPKIFDYADSFHIVLLPIGHGRRIMALYFIRNKTLDALFAREKVPMYPVNQ